MDQNAQTRSFPIDTDWFRDNPGIIMNPQTYGGFIFRGNILCDLEVNIRTDPDTNTRRHAAYRGRPSPIYGDGLGSSNSTTLASIWNRARQQLLPGGEWP